MRGNFSTPELKTLANSIEEMVFVWTVAGDLLWGNRAFERETGLKADDFGFQNEDNPFVVPEDLPHVLAAMEAFLKSDAELSAPIENRFFDVWGQARASRFLVHKVIWDGQDALLIVGILTDKDGLAEQVEEGYRQLVEAADDGILKLSEGGHILYANRRMQALTGLSVSELGRMPFDRLFVPEMQAEVKEALRAACVEQAARSVRAPLLQTGCWLDVKVAPIADTKGTAAALVIARDVTQVRALQAQALRQEREATLAQLVAGIAHDLNNIITGVLANATFLEDLNDLQGRDPIVRRTLADIHVAGERAGEMGRAMLAYLGQVSTERQTLDFEGLVRDTVRVVRPLVGVGIDVEFEASARHLVVRADPGQLGQIVMNLLTNAAQALGETGGRLSIALTDVELDDASSDLRPKHPGKGRYAKLSVRDDGHGMSQETVERVFEPYFTTKRTGHGLGLAAALGVLQEHRGAIRVQSQPGEGTQVDVYLPIAVAAEVEKRPSAPAPSSLAGKVVLVIDDEAPIRTLMERILTGSDAAVLSAGSGAAGLALFREQAVDAVVLDSHLPGEDGPSLVTTLREIRPHIPILVSSGYQECRTSEDVAFLPKPYRAAQLVAAVAALIE